MLQLHSWCSANKLEINPTKSAAIITPGKLHDVKQDVNILHNNQNITYCNSSKYLGVIIDNNLNFRTHIQNVENKVSKSVGILSKLRFLLPSPLFSTRSPTSYLYGLLLMGCTFPSYLSKLQCLQNNKAAGNISDSNFIASVTS